MIYLYDNIKYHGYEDIQKIVLYLISMSYYAH